MLYTIVILVSGVYIGQEYFIIPSVRILIENALIYLRNLRDPIVQQTMYERIYNIFW